MITYREARPIALVADLPEEAREWRNHPGIWRWCRQNTLISEDEHMEWWEGIEDDPSIKMFGLYRYDDKPEKNYYVGVCGFTSINTMNRSAEFSLYIASEHQGHGYGRRGLEVLLRHGFLDFGFKRIWGEVFDGNPAMKTFERLGFKRDGLLRSSYWKSGAWLDSHMISILDHEWLEIQKKKPHLEPVT